MSAKHKTRKYYYIQLPPLNNSIHLTFLHNSLDFLHKRKRQIFKKQKLNGVKSPRLDLLTRHTHRKLILTTRCTQCTHAANY